MSGEHARVVCRWEVRSEVGGSFKVKEAPRCMCTCAAVRSELRSGCGFWRHATTTCVPGAGGSGALHCPVYPTP